MQKLSPLRWDRNRLAIVLIVVGYVALALTYSLVNPIFESPDELFHYQYVRHVIDRGDLPLMVEGQHSEFFQPPLYYTLAAAAVGSIQVEPLQLMENPFWGYETFRFGVDNKARYLHADWEAFPYRGTALVIHVLRLGSILLGALTLIAVYAVLRDVFASPSIALGALAFIAFNPQYLFVSSSTSNDSLIALFGAVLLGLSIRVARSGLTGSRALSLAVLLALAVLTKLSASVLAAVPALAVLIAKTSWRRRIGTLALVVVAVLVLDGWWFLRNWMLYGDPAAINIWQRVWDWQTPQASFADVPSVLRYIWNSYWGQFGLGQIVLPEWVYGLTWLVGLIAVLGLARRLILRRGPLQADATGFVLLAVTAIAFWAAALWYGLASPVGAAGRFLFPAMSAVAGLLFFGLRGVYRPERADLDRFFAGGACAVMIAFAVAVLFGVIAPAYSPPARVTPEGVRSQTRPADIRFGDAAVLLGYAIDRDRVFPGEEVHVRLCWQTSAPSETPLYFVLYLVGPNDSVVGRRESFHGLGRYPSMNWQPDYVFCDDVPLAIEEWAPAPAVYGLEVALIEQDTRTRLTAIGSNGLALTPTIIAQVKVRSAQAAPGFVPNRISIDLGERVRLIGSQVTAAPVRAGESATVTLYWQARRVPDENYTVFVHLTDSHGRLIAQADSPPQSGRYPTSFWDADEVIVDSHTLAISADLPAGEYPVTVGLYLLATGQRLPIDGGPGDSIEIGRLAVEAAAR